MSDTDIMFAEQSFRAAVDGLRITGLTPAIPGKTSNKVDVPGVDYEYDFGNNHKTNFSIDVEFMIARPDDWVETEVEIIDEVFTSNFDAWVNLANEDLIDDTVVVEETDTETTFTEGTDYEINYSAGQIKVLSTGGMLDATNYHISYNYTENKFKLWESFIALKNYIDSDGGQLFSINEFSGKAQVYDSVDADYNEVKNILSGVITFECWED